MWICMSDGFVSAVQDHDDPSRLAVRARKREHLERLFPGHEIVTTPDRDYAARVFVSREEFAKVVAERIANIGYDNFKDSVADRRLHDLYLDFWTLHWRYQNEAKAPGLARQPSWGSGDPELDRGD